MFSPHVLFAGPICTGFVSCLPFTIIALMYTVLPIALALVALTLFIYRRIYHTSPKPLLMAMIIVVAGVAGYFGYQYFSAFSSNSKYQQSQSQAAKQLSFQLFQPTYAVPGYIMVENRVEARPQGLDFIYYHKKAQNARSSLEDGYYGVIESLDSDYARRVTTTYSISPDSNDVLIAKEVDGVTISVIGTINKSEAEHVLAALQPVSATDIKFHSDWADNR